MSNADYKFEPRRVWVAISQINGRALMVEDEPPADNIDWSGVTWLSFVPYEPANQQETSSKLAEPARAHDWIEDFQWDNGDYTTACKQCNSLFRGHKRRVVCKVCVQKERKVEIIRRLEEVIEFTPEHHDGDIKLFEDAIIFLKGAQ